MSLGISIRDVNVSFPDSKGGTRQILNDVNLDIDSNEFVCLLGPSGCGKTTLLNMIAGFFPATGGEMMIGTEKITKPGVERGVVFQEYGLFPWFTVSQNVEIGPRIRGIRGSELHDIGQHYLSMVGLRGCEHLYPDQLSGGMRQRVSIARALANEPQVLLLDEPFAALDAQTREELQAELLAIWLEEQITCVFVTHSVEECVYLGQRALIFNRAGAEDSIAAVVDIDLDYERDRTGWEFAQIEREIYKILHPERGIRRLDAVVSRTRSGHEKIRKI